MRDSFEDEMVFGHNKHPKREVMGIKTILFDEFQGECEEIHEQLFETLM